MLIKKKWFVILIFLFSLSAQATTLADIKHKLTAHTLLRGLFTQTKTMQMFNQPIISHGRFLLKQDQGLIWQQTDPFPVSLVLVKDKLRQQFADQDAEIIIAQDNPMIFYFSHLFLSLFNGEINNLTEQFKIELSENNTHWFLLLTPKSAPLNKIFTNISIEGQEFIENLTLTELNGDVSEIKFEQQQTTPATLSEEEQRAFLF